MTNTPDRRTDRRLAADAVLAGLVSPELVLVLPAEQRRLILESLPPVLDSVDKVRPGAPVLEQPSAPANAGTPRLSRRRLAAVVAVYTFARVVAAVPFYSAVVAGTFVVTLVVSALG